MSVVYQGNSHSLFTGINEDVCTLAISARNMEIGLLDVDQDGEHNGAGCTEISNIFAMQGDFVLERLQFY